MCAVSMIIDGYQKGLPGAHPWVAPAIDPNKTYPVQPTPITWPQAALQSPTRVEFEALKKEVEELKILLAAARRFDDNTGQPDCEQEEKVAFMKRLGEMLGVDMSEVLG